ncbi:MAG TPA: glycosyltransferase [Gaiellaceae bacterium]
METGDFVGRHVWTLVRGRDGSIARRLLARDRVERNVRAGKALNVVPFGSRLGTANAVNAAVTARLLRRLGRRLRQPVVLWIYDPRAAALVGECGEAFAVYDCVDDYAEQTTTAGKRALVAASDRLAAERSRLVFATSRTLYERQRRVNAATHLVPNVGDYEHFSPAADRGVAAPELAALPRPVVGFAGNFVPSKVDVALLQAVAAERPDWTVVLVGPSDPAVAADLARLAALPNVHQLGPKPYGELPRYVAAFDVALIPYVANDYTRSCFPLKLYEYLAAGKPVVAAGLPELCGMEPDVVVADEPRRFVDAVAQALRDDDDAGRSRRLELARRNTWEGRTERLLQLVHAELRH